MKPELNSRTQIHKLVNQFYSKVRVEETLGPIFNRVIKDWLEHMDTLTDFWEGNLLRSRSYSGDPIKKHQVVDAGVNHTVTMDHFGIWINLWVETIDENYEGEYAQLAKRRAANMATFIFMKIHEARG